MAQMIKEFGDIVISVRHYSIIILQLIKFYFLLLADILGPGVFNTEAEVCLADFYFL